MATFEKLRMQKNSFFLAATLALCLVAVGCGDDDDDDQVPIEDVGVTDVGDGADAGDVAQDAPEDAAEDAQADAADAEGDAADAADAEGDAAGATALVQVIHASPDDAASVVDVWVNDERLLDDFAYLSATPFVTVPAGADLQVDITASDATDNSSPVYSQTIPGSALTEGSRSVAIASGIIDDNFEIRASAAQDGAADGQVALQIFHGVPDAPAVDVTAADGAVTLADELSFGEFSDITTVDAADVTADVLLAGTTTPVVSVDVPLSNVGGQYLTVVARGTVDTTDDADFGATAYTADGTALELPEAAE